MKYFADYITKPFIKENKYRRILEIGASKGENSDKLLEIEGIELTIIDPCFDCDLAQKYSPRPHVRVLKGLSLEILPKLNETFDCIFIDGDHNWYTVYNELKSIEDQGLLVANGSIFLHDVGWPYGRRDMYFTPESIPEEFKHSYARKGILHNKKMLSDGGGINNHLYNATCEGGKRNGVLTAIQDFLKISKCKYGFFIANQQYGLGILIHLSNEKAVSVFKKWRMKILMQNIWEMRNSFNKY